jgi:hypothetical protein
MDGENIDKMTSITIRNIPLNSRRGFEIACVTRGITVQEALRCYITQFSFDEITERQAIRNAVNNIIFHRPDLVDQFIEEHEEFYKDVPSFQREQMRWNFGSYMPSYIFQKFSDYLKKKEDEAENPSIDRV